MKKIYQTPSFDVAHFNTVSVISTSGDYPNQSASPSDGSQMWGKRRPDIWGEDDE